jgi:hypothetical protein
MNWDEIEKKYQHFNKDWAGYPKEFCKEENKPTYNEIFENVQPTKTENWFESTHPFCKSCFSIYKEVCGEVGIFFGLGKNWKKEHLPDAVTKFILTVINQITDFDEKILSYQEAIHTFVDCINTRWFQHDTCFRSTDYKVNNNVDTSNPDHIGFILVLCREMKKIYPLYKNLINTKNEEIKLVNQTSKKNIPLIPNFLKDQNPQIINICRNIIKNYGNSFDKEDIEIIFESEDRRTQRRKSKSPIRNQKAKRQSRNKNAYKVPGKVIKDILKTKFNIE